MKKFFVFAALLGVLTMGVSAAESASVTVSGSTKLKNAPAVQEELRPEDEWTPFQVCFMPNLPAYSYNSNVYGIKSGWPITTGIGRVSGLEASWFYSGTAHMKGIQASWVANKNATMWGLQASWIFCMSTEETNGIQASCILNIADKVTGLQAGGFNYAGDFVGLQPGMLGNIAGDMTGAQFGLFNVAKELNGFQASAVNVAKESHGFQLGFVNVAQKTGFQIGLINVIKDGVLPVFPFINFSF